MSVITPSQFAPKIDSSVPKWAQNHLNMIYQKIGNHAQAFALQQQKIDALKSGSTTTTQVIVGGGGGGSVPGVATVGSVSDRSGLTSYTLTTGDNGAFVIFSSPSAIAVTLAPQTTPWFAVLVNQGALGAGTITATPSPGGVTISYAGNPGASSLPIPPTYAAGVAYDGTNWWAETFPVVPVNTPAVAHQVITAYNAATGAFTQGQESFADISGTAAVAQGGTGTGVTLAGLVRGSATAFTAAELSGDAVTSGSNAVTVVKVNGGSVPASQPALASNGSSQIVGAATTGSGSVVLSNAPSLSGAVGFANEISFPGIAGATVAASATAGAGTALPATPQGYLSITINGTSVKIPYYNP